MKRSKFTEEPIVYVLGQSEHSAPISDLWRQLELAEQTFYAGKKSTPTWVSANSGGCSNSNERTGG